jgi:peroxiredoxin Q/BCP
MDRVRAGDRAPEFSLPDQDGNPVTLSAVLADRSVVLYFYPRDETLGCTIEACKFRDEHQLFRDAGAEVLGVSDDSVDSHRGFAQHRQLPFRLLSDAGGAVRERYGVGRLLGVLAGRKTFVIDRHGVVRYVFSSRIAMHKHVSEALRIVRAL